MAQEHHVPKELGRYLIPGEEIIFIIHRHWVVLAEPVLTMLGGLVVLIVGIGELPGNPGHLDDILVVLFLFLLLRAAWRVFEWHHEHFLATNQRLMLVHGFLVRKVDIMPMSKVTDMRYDRTLPGRTLGYGVYVIESAGQDQALSTINFIPDSDLHYQQISQVIFMPPSRRASDRVRPSTSGASLPITEPEQSWWRR